MVAPTCWEDAAAQAIDGLWLNGVRRTEPHALANIERTLTKMKVRNTTWFGSIAILAFPNWGGSAIEMFDALVSKQRDYGHENIEWGGREGIILRMHDKVARLQNLQKKGLAALNESVADSWLDICGYAIIGLMWEKGTFMLPLREDAPEPAVEALFARSERDEIRAIALEAIDEECVSSVEEEDANIRRIANKVYDERSFRPIANFDDYPTYHIGVG